MPGPGTAWLDTVVASTVVSASGNSGVLTTPYSAQQMVVIASVTAYTSGTATFEVQWSFDGINFFSADQGTAGGTGTTQLKDTFANLAAVGTLYKVVPVRAPYYRVTWTTGAYTMNVQAGPAAPTASGNAAPDGFVLGATSFIGQLPAAGGAEYAPQFTYVPSTTLSAAYVQATPATMSSILAVPTIPGEVENMPINRMSLKLNVTANTWAVGAVFEVLWSFTGIAGSTWHGDPTDTFAGATAAFTSIKELVIKAPYFAIAITAGTPGSATFTADIAPTCL